MIESQEASVLRDNALLGLAADCIEVSNVLRDTTIMSALAVDKAQADRAVIDVLQAYKIGGFAASVIIEDEVIVGL
jgi:hypothetical protein